MNPSDDNDDVGVVIVSDKGKQSTDGQLISYDDRCYERDERGLNWKDVLT